MNELTTSVVNSLRFQLDQEAKNEDDHSTSMTHFLTEQNTVVNDNKKFFEEIVYDSNNFK